MPSAKSLLLLLLPPSARDPLHETLTDAFGAPAASLIQRRLLRDLLHGLQNLDPSFSCRVLHDPSTSESAARSWITDTGVPPPPHLHFTPQLAGEPGDQLRHAFREAFAENHARVFAIGTACPALTASTLRQANAALDESDTVFGPSSGGGYYLIGASRFEPRLFDVPWNRENTLRTSLARAAESGMTTRLLPALASVATVSEWLDYKRDLLERTPLPKAPVVFLPVYQERVWGGRALERRLGRSLPSNRNIGESWELVDRPEAQSLVLDGPLMGVTLADLWTHRRQDVFGPEARGDRFPLLFKILDAREDLSLQVHPPARVAADLGGQPKTEMWHIADAAPGARIYAGLREGVTPEVFRAALQSGSAASLVHSLEPATGDSLFIPSGRLHAIGAGLLIYEIQENSDTTYRVFDWNRTGTDGKPRKLHLDEALRSIDFHDVTPSFTPPEGDVLAQCSSFLVRKWTLQPHQTRAVHDAARFAVIQVVQGSVQCGGRKLREGTCFLIPAEAAHELDLRTGEKSAIILHTSVPAPAHPLRQAPSTTEEESEGFYRDLRRRVVAWAESRTGKRHPWLEYVLLAPDFFLLLVGLVSDRDVPARLKTLLASAIAYFMVPLDLFPEGLLGPAGYLDDIALAAFAIHQLLSHVHPDVIRRHWAGEGDVLALVQAIVGRVDSLIGSGLVKQIRDRLGL